MFVSAFKKIILGLFSAFLLFSVVLPGAMAKEKPLRIGVDSPYPPFAYVENGVLTGFDVDIAHALCKELARECDIQIVEFDRIIPSIVAGELDLGIAGMGATDERKKLVDFTDRYFRSHSIFIEREGENLGLKLEDLKDKKIATQAGTIQETYLKKVYGEVSEIMIIPDYEGVFEALKDGSADLIFVDGLPGYHYLRSHEGAGLETIGLPVHSDIVIDSSCIAVGKQQPELREAVNQAIQQLRRKGEYDRINRKYFDFNVY